MARRYQGSVPIVGMAGRDDTGPMEGFVEEHDLGTIPHTVDGDGSLWAAFGVRGQPAWVFIDRAGETKVFFGALAERDVEQQLDRIAAS